MRALLVCLLLLTASVSRAQDLPLKPLPSDFSVSGLFKPDPSYPYFEYANEVPFRPEARGHDPANAWWLAEMSMLAYAPLVRGGQIQEVLTRLSLGGRPIGSDAAGGTQGFLTWNDRFVIVALRGTAVNDRKDLSVNMRFWLTGGEESGVHRGFAAALDDGWPAIREGLRALPGRRVFFTGHSQGGAVAALAAERWIAEGGSVQGVYTYGTPRIGDVRFKRRYPVADHYRYENNNDLVTMVPFDGSLLPAGGLGLGYLGPMRYRHVGRLRLITSQGAVVAEVERSERIRDRWRGLLGAARAAIGDGKIDLRGMDFVRDHSPRYYAIATWNALASAPVAPKPKASFRDRLRRTLYRWRANWAQRGGLTGALSSASK